MLWIVALARAATLPECPVVTTPEEAYLARDDRGVAALYEALKAEAEAYAAGPCVTTGTETATDDTVTGTCLRADGGVVRRSTRETAREGDELSYPSDERLDGLEVERPTGTEWTRLALWKWTGNESGDYGGSSRTNLTASWEGTPLGLAADGSLGWETSTGTDTWHTYSHEGAAVNGCAWGWGDDTEPYSYNFGTTDLDVLVWYESDCEITRPVAYVNDVRYGRVDEAWRLVEVDRDGFSVADGDCDDTDPTVYPCAADVEFDGIDQDCDGEDLADADGDGHNDADGGGDDCDDTDATVYFGARDFGGDGVDQDCDGHDDIDADGDGRTLDGDSADPDCDDTDATISPAAEEIPYDGVDNDCSGEDAVDLDADGYVAAEAGGDDCDDTHPRRHPDASEPPCDGVDDDCDGADTCDEEAPAPSRGCAPGAPMTALATLLAAAAIRRRSRR